MVYSLEQTMQIMGCKRSKVFELLSNGTLERAPRFGREVRIYKDSVERALARPAPDKARGKRTRRQPVDFSLEDIPLFEG